MTYKTIGTITKISINYTYEAHPFHRIGSNNIYQAMGRRSIGEMECSFYPAENYDLLDPTGYIHFIINVDTTRPDRQRIQWEGRGMVHSYQQRIDESGNRFGNPYSIQDGLVHVILNLRIEEMCCNVGVDVENTPTPEFNQFYVWDYSGGPCTVCCNFLQLFPTKQKNLDIIL